MLRKWMMDRDTLGCSGWRCSKNLGKLASGDYSAEGEGRERKWERASETGPSENASFHFYVCVYILKQKF